MRRSRLALLAGLTLLLGGSPGPEPCEDPIAWRIAGIDAEFELDSARAVAAVRAAGMLWEEAHGDLLFVHDAEEGFPIRFEYDGRHTQSRARAGARAERAALDERVDRIRAEVEAAEEELQADRAGLAERRAALEERLEEHRAEVAYWNEQGGAEGETLERLQETGARLEEERQAVNREVGRLNARREEINARIAEANALVQESNRRREELAASAPEIDEPARYRESRRELGSWVMSVQREIRVFQFYDEEHLVLVLAHELGHALGMSHVDVPGALMHPEGASRPPGMEGAGLHPADREALAELCGAPG